MITLHFSFVWIPIVITILAIVIPLAWPDSGGTYAGIGSLCNLLLGLPIALIAWIVYAVMK